MPFFGQDLMTMSREERTVDVGGLQEAARALPPAGCRRHRCSHGQEPARCAHRADRKPGLADRSGQRRSMAVRRVCAIDGDIGRRAILRSRVPMGMYKGLPIGISFFGRAWSEPTLIKLAYAYEQATRHRKPPLRADRLEA